MLCSVSRLGKDQDVLQVRLDIRTGPVPLLTHRRLDRLLLLLDTGSSASVRQTAAKQLAQLAAKAVTADVTTLQDDVKVSRQHAERGDPAAWAELMAVLARVSAYTHLPDASNARRSYHIYTPDLMIPVSPPPSRFRRYARLSRCGNPIPTLRTSSKRTA